MSLNGFINASDYTTVQDALNTGKNVFIDSNKTISTALTFVRTGQIIEADNAFNTALIAGGANDIIRMNYSGCKVRNISFNPHASCPAIRMYASYLTVEDNTFISGTNNTGNAIVIQDHTPAGVAVPGAYIHNISKNNLGFSGYAFARSIDVDSPLYGLQACKFRDNIHYGDNFINIPYGGGNLIDGNLFQSSSGTVGTPAGNCLQLGTVDTNELITGNYFERYAKCAYSTRTINTTRILNFNTNSIEACTADVVVQSGITNYINDMLPIAIVPVGGAVGQCLTKNSAANFDTSWTTVSNGGNGSLTTYMKGVLVNTNDAISFSDLDPGGYYLINIRGNGAAKSGITISNGAFANQRLELGGDSWGVGITGSNLNLASACTLGGNSGQIASIALNWNTSTSKWDEQGRIVRP